MSNEFTGKLQKSSATSAFISILFLAMSVANHGLLSRAPDPPNWKCDVVDKPPPDPAPAT